MVAKVKVRRKSNIDLVGILKGPRKVKVGFPKGESNSEIVDIAIWNHYGTDGGGWGGPIPARPFLLNAIRRNRLAYFKALKASVPKLLRKETDLSSILAKLGILAEGHVKAEIIELDSPPNAQVTIDMKGSSNPLVNEGTLGRSVTYEVVD